MVDYILSIKLAKNFNLPSSAHRIASETDGTFVPSNTFPFSFLIEFRIEVATENVAGPPSCQNYEVHARYQVSQKGAHDVGTLARPSSVAAQSH